MDIPPFEARQFADSQAGVDRHINHGGVRLGDQFDEQIGLLGQTKVST